MTKCREFGGFIWTDDEHAFLRLARDEGWKAALKSVQQEDEPDKIAEASAPNRLGWLTLVDVAPSTCALDIGAGTGGLACQLAEICEVVAIDTSEVDVEFLRIRASQERLANFRAEVADATNLPFEDNYFDLVTMNGVLEWIPIDHPDRDPAATQLAALKEVHRVLKQDGRFLLGIENRTYLGYFLGMPEQHVNLKYISLLSRPDADQLSHAIRGVPFLEHTYSRGEAESLLRQAGFERIETYWMYPNYRWPEYMVPLDNRAATLFFVNRMLSPQDFSDGGRLVEYLFYSLTEPSALGAFVGHYGFVCG